MKLGDNPPGSLLLKLGEGPPESLILKVGAGPTGSFSNFSTFSLPLLFELLVVEIELCVPEKKIDRNIFYYSKSPSYTVYVYFEIPCNSKTM